MAVKVGKDAAVKLATDSVLRQGTWRMDGVTTDQLETTEFGDEWKKYEFGLKDGGTVSCSGFFDPADTTGQNALRLANVAGTNITTLRLYVDNTSYYEPCQTTGYWSPETTENANTQLSHVNVTSFNVSADKAGVLTAEFSFKVSGCMVLI